MEVLSSDMPLQAAVLMYGNLVCWSVSCASWGAFSL